MAHVNFNHLNASAFNSFVPEATKTANNVLFKNVLIVGGVAIVLWFILKPKTESLSEVREKKE
jgi:hypothetical protein